MRISTLAGVLLAFTTTVGCPGKQAQPTTVAVDEPDFCGVVSSYLADVAAQKIDEPMV